MIGLFGLEVLAVLFVGSLLTTRAMLAEKVEWRRPLVMLLGMLVTVLAMGGLIAIWVNRSQP